MTRRFGIVSSSSAAARSRSTSTATTCPARVASGRVSAPRPGPISRKVSSGVGSIASTTLATHTGSRKCCPNRFRALAVRARLPAFCLAPSRSFLPLPPSPFRLVIILAAPVTLLDLLNLLFAQAEVVTYLVNQCFADDGAHVVVALAVFLDRLLKNGDAVRQGVAVAPRTLW